MAIQSKNPFGNGRGGDAPMKDGGNDFTKEPSPQPAPAEAGNDFTKNPGGFTGATAKPSNEGQDLVPPGGRSPFGSMPAFKGKPGATPAIAPNAAPKPFKNLK